MMPLGSCAQMRPIIVFLLARCSERYVVVARDRGPAAFVEVLRRTGRAVLASRLAAVLPGRASSTAEDHGVRHHLRAETLLAVPLIAGRLETALDEDLRPLRQDLPERLGPPSPDDRPDPLDAFLTNVVAIEVRLVAGHVELQDSLSARGDAEFRIGPEVPENLDAIVPAAHRGTADVAITAGHGGALHSHVPLSVQC